ncbi:hypothetical protein [uncultured Fusobacterium sp.]|uniref:AbiTii domain-containing protein n=1 Tax=uncultured Fusobacterium sp. TaxID=159267 RepID=UPI0025E882EC|nr:hypothetical protein [uncultured Fusobacterium sp.]
MKSILIQDLLQKNCDLENIMLRLKVILFYLENEDNLKWIDQEINGYSKEEKVPDYRVATLTPYISMVDGINFYKNILAGYGAVKNSEDLQKIISYEIRDGINSVKEDPNLRFYYNDFIRNIFTDSIEGRRAFIVEAYGKIDVGAMDRVRSVVKNKVLSILLVLEKKYGSLDDYDPSEISEEEKKEVSQIIKNYITMGDNNTIDNSSLGITGGIDEKNN